MPIINNTPIVKPAENERIYDKLWLVGFSTLSNTFDKAKAVAVLRPYRTNDGNGENEFSTLKNIDLRLEIDNLFNAHAEKPHVEQAITAVLENFDTIKQQAPTSTLALLELVTQAIGAAAQADKAFKESQNSSSSSSNNSSSSSGA